MSTPATIQLALAAAERNERFRVEAEAKAAEVATAHNELLARYEALREREPHLINDLMTKMVSGCGVPPIAMGPSTHFHEPTTGSLRERAARSITEQLARS